MEVFAIISRQLELIFIKMARVNGVTEAKRS